MSFGFEKLLGGPHTGIRQGREKSLVSIDNVMKKMFWSEVAASSSPLPLSRNAETLAQHHVTQGAKGLSEELPSNPPAASAVQNTYTGRYDSETQGIWKWELGKVNCYEKAFLQIEFFRASQDQISKASKGFHFHHPLGKIFHQRLDFSIRSTCYVAKLLLF